LADAAKSSRTTRANAAASGAPQSRSAIRRLAERGHNIVHWSEFDRGGHFPAMEVPDLLVGDLREFFRRLRSTRLLSG
jgi:epoxide hydrolase